MKTIKSFIFIATAPLFFNSQLIQASTDITANNRFLLAASDMTITNKNPTVAVDDVPSLPPSPCYNDECNEFMEKLHSDFLNLGQTPTLEPAVYSGTCRHLGVYSPDRDHYSVVLIDQVPNDATPSIETTRFSTILAFFYEENEFKSWDLVQARKEMSPYWLDHGFIKYGDSTYRVVIPDEEGYPAMMYWFRQNPITQELYYIIYSGVEMRSFCRLQKN